MKKLLTIIVLGFFVNNLAFSNSIKVNQFSKNKESYEKMENLFNEFKV